MTDTALTIITDALLDLGVLADEETPTASQAAGGLRKLNNMIDAWSIENMMVYAVQSNVFALNGSQSYTLGVGGNFNVDIRQNDIFSASLRDTTQPLAQQMDFPLYLMTDQEYADFSFKGMTTTLGSAIYIDGNYPLANVYILPIPSGSPYSLVLWANTPLKVLTLNQQVVFPPGYKRALTANLCIELAPSYGVNPSPATIKIAQDAIAGIKTANFQLNELKIDPRLTDEDGLWIYPQGVF